MNKRSNHLVKIITATVCITLLITSITFFKGSVGDLFSSIINKEAESNHSISNGNITSASFSHSSVFDASEYIRGLVPNYNGNDNYEVEMKDSQATDISSIVYPLKHGKAYILDFPTAVDRLCVLVFDTNPKNLKAGEKLKASAVVKWSSGIIKHILKAPDEDELQPYIYVPQKEGEYLLIYTGSTQNNPVYIGEYTIVAEHDTEGDWYIAPTVSDLMGNTDSFGNYNWSSEEVVNNLYEPMRKINPDYVKRTSIGKDESGQYDMYSYIFKPDNYEQTVFLTAGMHANEEEAYFALANFMQQVFNADGSVSQLKYLRENVRFIVIPIINVWGVNQTHSIKDTNWSIRYNSNNVDLNRDFEDLSQSETTNLIAEFEKYKDSISFAIDFHTNPEHSDNTDLFYNFPIVAENADCNLKTVNHIYHTLVKKGYVEELRGLYTPCQPSTLGAAVRGKYTNTKYWPNYVWNNYRIPIMTVEHLNNDLFPDKGSAEGMRIAVEAFGNFIIQNALFFAG